MTFKRMITSFLVLEIAVHGVAWACSCAQDMRTPEERFHDNDVVFYGEVLSVREPLASGCGGTVSTADPMNVRFEVAEGFKGAEAGDEIQLQTAREDASCGVDFQEGEVWLIYTSDEWLGLCDPIAQLADDDPELDALRGLAR